MRSNFLDKYLVVKTGINDIFSSIVNFEKKLRWTYFQNLIIMRKNVKYLIYKTLLKKEVN